MRGPNASVFVLQWNISFRFFTTSTESSVGEKVRVDTALTLDLEGNFQGHDI